MGEPTASTRTIVKHAALTLMFAGLLLTVPALTATHVDDTPYETYAAIAAQLMRRDFAEVLPSLVPG